MPRQRYPTHTQLAISEAVEPPDTRPRVARIELVLPFPPSANGLYPTIITKRGQTLRVPSSSLKHYRKAVSQTLGVWLTGHGCRPPLPPWRLSIRAYPPDDGRRHDLDNLTKGVLDSLMAAINGDDDNVVEIHLTKEPREHWARIVVTLEGEVDA